MKSAGGGKRKGSAFEREVCVKLSLWVTNGKKKDCFWRSAMSGGRATVHHKKGQLIRQAGDICAVSPEGFPFCDKYYVECKFYNDLDIEQFLFKGCGKLDKFWLHTRNQAAQYQRKPLLICRQNTYPTLIIGNSLTPYMAHSPFQHCYIDFFESFLSNEKPPSPNWEGSHPKRVRRERIRRHER